MSSRTGWSTGDMSGFGVARRLAAVMVVAGVLAGCTGASSPAGPPMMGAAGYTFPPLTYAAPPSLPGTTVEVMLGDMGMTQ